MSTSYRIVGRGKRLTLAIIRNIARGAGCELLKPRRSEGNPKNTLVLRVGDKGYVYLARTGKTAWNEFDRYGGNYNAADSWCELLEDAGYPVLSEHDEGYFT